MYCCWLCFLSFFFFNDTATTEIYTLSLHDALPICRCGVFANPGRERSRRRFVGRCERSEEHTSELQSRFDLVCRLLLEKKKTRRAKSRILGGLFQNLLSCVNMRRPDHNRWCIDVFF